MAAGQAIWSADGTGIILTTFPVEPRRLGVRFYNTRKSRIAVVPAPTWLSPATVPPPQQGQASSASAAASNTSALRWLTPEDEWSARNPKLSPDGSKLIYVVSADSTAHFSASKLMCAPWPSAALTRMPLLDSATVLDIVPVAASSEEFPGLFLAAEQLPRRVRASLVARLCGGARHRTRPCGLIFVFLCVRERGLHHHDGLDLGSSAHSLSIRTPCLTHAPILRAHIRDMRMDTLGTCLWTH